MGEWWRFAIHHWSTLNSYFYSEVPVGMPRRRDYLSDGSDSEASLSQGSEDGANSQEDEDSKAERRLFEYNSRKRRKTGGGKEAAWEGIFGEESEGARGGGRGLGSRRGGKRGGFMGGKTDWTKCVFFTADFLADPPEPPLSSPRLLDLMETPAKVSR